jgi:trehalose/maltose hydrolase-like predicted phosphorylase
MANQRLFEIDQWKIKTNKFEKEHKRLQESLTSLANGYMGIRVLKEAIQAKVSKAHISQGFGSLTKRVSAGGKTAIPNISGK